LLHAAAVRVTELELWSYTFRESTLPDLAVPAAAAGFAAVTVTPELWLICPLMMLTRDCGLALGRPVVMPGGRGK